MKITRFDDGKIGIVVGERIVDVSDLLDADVYGWPSVAMNQLIADFERYRERLHTASLRPGVPLESVKLLTPVPAASPTPRMPSGEKCRMSTTVMRVI